MRTKNPRILTGSDEHYKEYCNILSRVISTAKKLYLNKIIATSNNKAKATWEVIRNATGNGHACTDVTYLKITGKNFQNHQDIVNLFNNFFLDMANVTKEGTNKNIERDKRPMDYLYASFLQPFPKLILKKTNCNEIEEIIISLS
jgi:hypothetical protein